MKAARPIAVAVALPAGWVTVDLNDPFPRPTADHLEGGQTDVDVGLRRAVLQRSLTNAVGLGLQHLATWTSPRGMAGSRQVSCGLAISLRRLDAEGVPAEQAGTEQAAYQAPTLDTLRAALFRADRATVGHVRPLEPPTEVLLRSGFGLRRGALHRVPVPGAPPSDGVVLVDRFLFAAGPVLVRADFHTPDIELHTVLRPHFEEIALTIEVTHGG